LLDSLLQEGNCLKDLDVIGAWKWKN